MEIKSEVSELYICGSCWDFRDEDLDEHRCKRAASVPEVCYCLCSSEQELQKPVIKKSGGGTWLLRYEPIPFGKTHADVSIVVHRYRYGWYCSEHTKPIIERGKCPHIKAATAWEYRGQTFADESDFVNHDFDRDEGLSGRAAKDLTDPFDLNGLGW